MFHRSQKQCFGEGHVLIDLFVPPNHFKENVIAEIWHTWGEDRSSKKLSGLYISMSPPAEPGVFSGK